MIREIRVHLLPDLTSPEELKGDAVVVIDVLRACTSIVHALAAGAERVIPCLEVEAARSTATQHPADQVVLGGERQGVRIEGFDLGNSPAEYTAESVGGKTVVMTTTNGTRAMEACRQARRVLIGTFVNLGAVLRDLQETGQDASAVHLVCAGTHGKVSFEDVLFAGCVVDRLTAKDATIPMDDSARLALASWKPIHDDSRSDALSIALRQGQGGQNVIRIGCEADIDLAAKIDSHAIVPRLDLERWQIVPA